MYIDDKNKRQVRRILTASILLVLFMFVKTTLLVEAAEVEHRVLPPLIQSTTEEDDIQALLNLNMFYANMAKESDTKAAKELVVPSIVKIDAGIYVGSGVIMQINEQGVFIVSSKHVLKNIDSANITFYDESSVAGDIIAVSGQYDMAVVQIPLERIDTFTLRFLRQVNIDVAAYENMMEGESMFTLGSTDGVAKNFYRGTIEDTWEFVEQFNYHMLHSNCYAKSGMSGGGTFDSYGNYLGIITGGMDDQSVSVPVKIVAAEYEELTGNDIEQ